MGGGRAVFSASSSPEHLNDSDEYDVSDKSSTSSSSSTSVTSFDTIASSHAAPHGKTYTALLESYRSIPANLRSAINDAKRAILGHEPGDWMEKVGGLTAESYDIPAITTLLLVGLRGSGKSSLVNRITRVFEDDQFAPDRAQVYHSWAAEGTCFLQEYPIPKNSETLCVYDTRGLSIAPSDNIKLFQSWMLEGVCHGTMDIRVFDDPLTRDNMMIKARQFSKYPCKKRVVSSVVLVVHGLSILQSLERKESHYIDVIVEIFNSPFLSFKDDKPIVVITHGDELSIEDRVFVRANLGEMLGVPSSTQIFDIPDNMEYDTQISILNMLRFCIERADRNILPKPTYQIKMMLLNQRWQKFVDFGAMMASMLFKKGKGIWNNSRNMDLLDEMLLWLTILVCTFFLARGTGLLMEGKLG